ncbi:MAG TPA: hypothetical protein VI584_06555 [Nitrospiria bacterium]|nr:hypothetical protein [Nitrospiria bacterium]
MIWLAFILATIPILTGCGPGTRVFVHPDIKNYHLEKIAIIPFTEDDKETEEGALKSRRAEKGSGEKMTRIFYEAMRTRADITIIPMEDVVMAAKEMADKEGQLSIKTMALKVGRELRADAILIGRVTSYQERIGGSFGITRPASVGFEVDLYNVQDEMLLWKSGFYETQSSLTENIGSLPLFIKRGGKWITADELARYGAEEVVRGYPAVE